MHEIPSHVPPELVTDFDYRRAPGLRTGDPQRHLLDQVRGGPRIIWSRNDGGYWVLTRSEDVLEVMKRPDDFSSFPAAIPYKPGTQRKLAPLELDPPDHGPFRNAEAPIFSPHAVNEYEGTIREMCADLVHRVAGRGECDFVADFARPLPAMLFGHLLDLPVEALTTFLEWAHHMNAYAPGDARQVEAVSNISRFLVGLVAERQQSTADDLISQLWRRPIGERPATADEVFDMALLIFMAGLDTTTNALSFIMAHLATHAQDRAHIAGLEGIPEALEELLRVYPVSNHVRTASRDIDFDGVTIKQGDHLVACLTLANRDIESDSDCDTVDLHRPPRVNHTFGAGPHRCIGSHLARREMRLALEEWHRAIPDYRVADGMELRSHGGPVMALAGLPLVWTP